jgi:hypothetical protein
MKFTNTSEKFSECESKTEKNYSKFKQVLYGY